MKVLVLGGTRFMGRYVSSTFLGAGAHVTVANRGTRDGHPDTTNVICDRSIPGSLEQFRDSQFDAVIDFSAYSSSWVEEAGNFFANKIGKYIFISTGAVYSSSNTFPITEDFPKGPPHLFAPYALEKMRSEAFLRDFSNEGFFQTISCRLPFVLGPENYEDRESFVFSRLLANKPILLENDGKALHSFIFAGDVADALLAIANTDKSIDGEAFNIAMPQGTTSRGFVEMAAKICSKTPKILSYNPKDFGLSVEDFNLRNVTFPFPDNSAFLNSDKIREALGFVPAYSLEKSLARYLQWWTDQGDFAPKEYELENRVLSAL